MKTYWKPFFPCCILVLTTPEVQNSYLSRSVEEKELEEAEKTKTDKMVNLESSRTRFYQTAAVPHREEDQPPNSFSIVVCPNPPPHIYIV